MTITTISPRELELEREVTRLEYELTLSEFNSRVYFDGATTIQQHLKDEIKALKAKLAELETPVPVAWRFVDDEDNNHPTYQSNHLHQNRLRI